jgi:hypothetical protein
MSTSNYHNTHHQDVYPSSEDSDLDIFEPSNHDQQRSKLLSRALLPSIPDLRFEQSYLKSIIAFVHVEEMSQELRVVGEKGKGMAKIESPQEPGTQEVRRDVKPIVDSKHHLVNVEWSQVVWITTRDQLISPFLQGALW